MKTIESIKQEAINQQQTVSNYYQFQSKIYDLTRWAFLFGRLEILQQIPYASTDAFTIVEVGCGTGFTMAAIARRFPKAQIIGVDVSADMLSIAKNKLNKYGNQSTFFHQPYNQHSDFLKAKADVILFSYSLSMINPQWKELIQKGHEDLKEGGKMLIVDFYNSHWQFFKNHMSNHHVRMDAHILPEAEKLFNKNWCQIKKSYAGIWEYYLYAGEK